MAANPQAEESVRVASRWELAYEGYDPDQEPLREALCTLGNGYFATRGAAPELPAGGAHYPGTYVAGLYNRLRSEVGGRSVVEESLVNVPNWLPLRLAVGEDGWLSVDGPELVEHTQVLDMRHGLLTRRLRFRDHAGRETAVTQRRMVHLIEEHLAALETTVRAENWSGKLRVFAGVDGGVENNGVARYRDYASRHLETVERMEVDPDTVALSSRTTQSRIEVCVASRTRVCALDGAPPPSVTRRYVTVGDDTVGHELAVAVEEGAPVRIDKVVALYNSRDPAISEPVDAALTMISSASDFGGLVASHALGWDEQWRRFSIRVQNSPETQRILNLHVFHALQTASMHSLDRDVGIPARGLHGEAYRGHIFWDELFVFPLLTYRVPEVAASLLRYRYRRLAAARRAAREAGCRGAMFPWQSGSSGREETQTVHLNPKSGHWLPDRSRRQRHINIAVAYNVWQYVAITGDVDFLARFGAELFIETTRLWSSLATYDPIADRYDICGVMGPDEFHDTDPNWDGEGLRNNAYTNVMAAWALAQVPKLLELLPRVQRLRIENLLGLTAEELARFDELSRKLKVPFHDGVISQFEGYEALADLDWERYRRTYDDIARLDRILEAEGDDVNNYKASKQADVLMLFFLLSVEQLGEVLDRLGYPFDADQLQRNIRYYLARTSHGSTLSRVVHSWVLARTDRAASLELFESALRADIADVQGGTTPEGIHIGAMAGTVDLVVRGYSGLEVRDDVLRFKPSVPSGIERIAFTIYYRRRWLDITLTERHIEITSEQTEQPPVPVEVRGRREMLASGATLCFDGLS